MTRAHILVMVKQANAAMAAGDCDQAQYLIGQAWLALGVYSAGLAQRGVSPATAVSLHKTISKVLLKAGKRCGFNTTIPMTNRAGGLNPDLAPMTNRTVGPSPDLIQPGFMGTGDQIYSSIQTTLTTLGIAAALFGVGYGFWTMYRHVGYVRS